MRETSETLVLRGKWHEGMRVPVFFLSFFLSFFLNILLIDLEISSIITESRQINQYSGK
jgi:hypothetical protein